MMLCRLGTLGPASHPDIGFPTSSLKNLQITLFQALPSQRALTISSKASSTPAWSRARIPRIREVQHLEVQELGTGCKGTTMWEVASITVPQTAEICERTRSHHDLSHDRDPSCKAISAQSPCLCSGCKCRGTLPHSHLWLHAD